MSGFTSGDGSFHVVIKKSTSKAGVFTRFSIHLQIKELEVIKGLAKFFYLYETEVTNTVTYEKYFNYYVLNKSVILQITKTFDNVNKIIPFFEKYPISGIKTLDFANFKEVAYIIKNKEHLTEKGYNKILEIKSNMNQKRSW